MASSSASAPLALASTSEPCQHLLTGLANGTVRAPRPSEAVHKEECTLCFDAVDVPSKPHANDLGAPTGVDVCLSCFNGSCPRTHSRLHPTKTGHAVVVRARRWPRPPTEEEKAAAAQLPQKLAVPTSNDEDKYEWSFTPACLVCEKVFKLDVTFLPELADVLTGVRLHYASARQNEIQGWEEEIVPCTHTNELVQVPPEERHMMSAALPGEEAAERSCSSCNLTENLWLCLTCGNLGCGRAQFGGVEGHSHALSHFEATGHPCSVKQGTITPEGHGDVYCYACNDAREDKQLASHLKGLGLQVEGLTKTEKSMTELQIEQNFSFDFSMTGDDGKALEPVFGPDRTGLKNLGNSCYLNSVLQSLFSLPVFQQRYAPRVHELHVQHCTQAPDQCIECQVGKVADGLLSGRYSVLDDSSTPVAPGIETDEAKDKAPSVRFQRGLKPNVLKQLVGAGNPEFSTMRQQDASEFLQYFLTILTQEDKRLRSNPTASSGSEAKDAPNVLSFELEQRLQCLGCSGVKYSTERVEGGLTLPVPFRPIKSTSEEEDKDKPVQYEPVSLTECLDLFTAPESVEGYSCPACQTKTTATKQTKFKTFPQVLATTVARFTLVGWVPTKVNVPITVPLGNDTLSLDSFLSAGLQEGEVPLPDDGSTEQEAQIPAVDAGAMSQLTAMGFPEVRATKALLATGNTGDAEAAMNWLFGHMEDPDIDDPIDPTQFVPSQSAPQSPDTSMLEEMGFSRPQARKALRVNGNNPEIAVAWLFENPMDPGEDEVPPEGEVEQTADTRYDTASTPATYRLRSFISHKGPSVHSGHYVAHVRQGNSTDDWVLFNDEKVVRAPLSSPSDTQGQGSTQDVGVRGLAPQAYVYFLERN